jgi:hypothetical protein
MEMDLREPNVVIDGPFSAEGLPVAGRRYLSGQYIIMTESFGTSAFYSFIDMHASPSHINAARWTTIRIDPPVLAFAFAAELNLVVTISCVNLLVSAHSFSS